ncbi:hypothetical protein CHARACLAT_033547 [Characodon lateralis]|uniref:Uncharacterized protein n=1 Tax=Characodon lateralis TaxID=208331 RepID=A0ABU7DLW4_9TELE|nr:hypothetical protein [Characodon lateralis]
MGCGVGGVPGLWHAVVAYLLHCGCWVVPVGLSSALLWGSQVCCSSHMLLHIFMENPYIHKRAHTHRCLDSGVNKYTDVLNCYHQIHLAFISTVQFLVILLLLYMFLQE